jgi:MSHA biogenesis protein MshN
MLVDLDDRRADVGGKKSQLEFLSVEKSQPKKNILLYFIVVMFLSLLVIGWQFYSLGNSGTDTSKQDLIAFIADPVVDNISANNKVLVEGESGKHEPKVLIPQVSSPKKVAIKTNKTNSEQQSLKVVAPPPVIKKSDVTASVPTSKKIVKTVLPPTAERIDKQVMSDARGLIAQGGSRRAEQQLREQLSENSASLHSGKLLASLLLAQQRPDEAQAVISQLQTHYPKDIEVVMLQARLYLLQGEPAKAVEVQRLPKPLLVEYPSYYELLALASQRAGQYELSGRVYKGLLEFDDSKGDWWVGLAIAHDMQKQYSIARKAYRQALLKKDISESLQQYAQQRVSELVGL